MIKSYLKVFFLGEEFKKRRRTLSVILLLSFALFLLNYFVLFKYANQINFSFHTALSNLLFIRGISPYSPDISDILSNYLTSRSNFVGLPESQTFFGLVYQLIPYLLFSFLNSLHLSIALWMTINQLLLISVVSIITKLFGISLNNYQNVGMVLALMVSFFGFSNVLASNTAIIQMYFFINAIYFVKRDKKMVAGLMFGLSGLSLHFMWLPILLIIVYLMKNGNSESPIWFFISTLFLSLIGFIFDSGWLLKMTRNIFLLGNFYPMTDYNHALLNWFNELPTGNIFRIAPIILLLWIFLESIRNNKSSIENLFWMLSLSSCLIPFILMRVDFSFSILYFFPFVLLIYLWEKYSQGVIKHIVQISLTILCGVIPLFIFVLQGNPQIFENPYGFYFPISLIFIFLLYWSRWWIAKPYDLKS